MSLLNKKILFEEYITPHIEYILLSEPEMNEKFQWFAK